MRVYLWMQDTIAMIFEGDFGEAHAVFLRPLRHVCVGVCVDLKKPVGLVPHLRQPGPGQ